MSLRLAWPTSEAPQQIAPGQIHVWAWPIDNSDADVAADAALLDKEELSRFHRFRFDRDRLRFAIAHGNMRRILGAYLRREPEDIDFCANAFGKPELTAASAEEAPAVRFNLSHSRSLALLALSPDIEVGVDAEDIRDIEPGIAESHFSPAELAALASLEGDAWLHGFYHCWTRKEAILKAEGVGLHCPLDAFDVSLLPDEPAELLGARPGAALRRHWMLHDLSPAQGTAGALAAASSEAQVCCFTLRQGSSG